MNDLDLALGNFKAAVDVLPTDQTSLGTAEANLAKAQQAVAEAKTKINTDMADLQGEFDVVVKAAIALGLKANV